MSIMRRFPFWLFAVGLSLCVPPSRAQSAPGVINYQGRLTDNTPQQTGVSAALPMQFSLWDAASGGTSLWQEPASGGVSITVTNGIFSASLGGNGVPLGGTLFAGGTDRWLQITLHPGTASEEILQPRQRLAASAWAHSAAQAGDSANLGGIAPAGWQTRVGGACQPGSGIRRIYADGTVDCQVDSTGTLYSAGAGLTLTGSQFSVNFDGGGTAATAARSDHAHAAPALRALTVTRYGPGLVASDRPGIYCGGSCAGQFNDGETVTLSATPEPGGGFSGWTGACTGTAACTLVMSAARSVGAVFSAPLAVQKSGTGSGTIVSTPAGINCGSSCAAAFGAGAMVTLTAAPASDSQFAGWLGACSGAGPCTVTMDGAKSVAALFTSNPYFVFVRAIGGGVVSSTPSGISCGATCAARFNGGQLLNFTATADPGWAFVGWSGACSGTGGCAATMDGDKNLTARFIDTTYPLSITPTGLGSGVVTSSPAGINCGATCSAPFLHGTPVVLSAAPSAGSTFAGWSGSGCSGTGTCNVTVTAAASVSAAFTLNNYALSVTRSGTGSGTVTSTPSGINCGPTCIANYAHGTLVQLTPAPSSGSAFAGWSGACTGTGSCIVSMTAATGVTANFTLNSYTLTVSKNGAGAGTVTSNPAGINCGATCAAPFNHGTVVTLSAAANAGSAFAGWSGGGCAGTGTCVINMTAALTVTATFN